MTSLRFLILILSLNLLFWSCSSKKDVLYLQDVTNNDSFESLIDDYLISHGDILNIKVVAENPETLQMFSPSNSTNTQISNQTRETLIFKGYAVDINGYINYPYIGRVKVDGLSINAAVDLFQSKLVELGIFTDPSVDIKILNQSFTIIGEVNNPGKFFFDKNSLTIFEAIGMAGDLTINGERRSIKLIRKMSDEKNHIFNLDLTNSEFMTSKSFQIFPGDVIIVNPNTTRIKNAGIIGNSGTLLSLLSFLLSSIIVINR